VELTIPRRYCGPPESGNGGWVSGAVAEHVPISADRPAVTVRLASPPPLDRALSLVVDPAPRPRSTPGTGGSPGTDGTGDGTGRTGDGTGRTGGGTGGIGIPTVRLLDGDHLIATASASPDLDGDLPPPVDLAAARAAEARFEGLTDHPFPTCFSCGTARDPDDALCLRPGPLDDGTGRYATTWVPHEVAVPLVWASLDCPGGWSAGIAGRPMVLGTMTARVLALPAPGRLHVVIAWQRGSEGRKHHSGTALYSPDGSVLARAEATWIAVDPASVRPKEAS
jgi:hypothetical protein